jgi:hypothetical protein
VGHFLSYASTLTNDRSKWVTSQTGATREAPVRTEPHPTRPLRCLTLLQAPINVRRDQEYHSCQDADDASCDTKIVLNSRGDRQLSLQSVEKGKYPQEGKPES